MCKSYSFLLHCRRFKLLYIIDLLYIIEALQRESRIVYYNLLSILWARNFRKKPMAKRCMQSLVADYCEHLHNFAKIDVTSCFLNCSATAKSKKNIRKNERKRNHSFWFFAFQITKEKDEFFLQREIRTLCLFNFLLFLEGIVSQNIAMRKGTLAKGNSVSSCLKR